MTYTILGMWLILFPFAVLRGMLEGADSWKDLVAVSAIATTIVVLVIGSLLFLLIKTGCVPPIT
jgi:hypothetical protein